MNLNECKCGQTPDYKVIGIGSTEYEQIECQKCQRSVMLKRDDSPDAESVWNYIVDVDCW